MGLRERAWRYLRENWGAPLVLAFILLLIVSAVDLGFGLSDSANTMAVYAFYLLSAGVALQIASYVKFGEGTIPESRGPRELGEERGSFGRIRGRKVAAFSALAIVIVGTGVGIYLQNVSSEYVAPVQIYPYLTAGVNFVKLVHEPDNSTIVIFDVSVSGGKQPYNFTVSWPDGITRSSEMATFSRSFDYNQTIPRNAIVKVTSGDKQAVVITVTINSTATT